MTSKIVRADGTTVLSGVKSVTYVEKVNADTDLRPGCVASAYIRVEVYGAQEDAPAAGEALTYYQVQDNVETLIGTFYAEPSIPTKTTYAFTAYDAVAKLDVDFSAWLTAHQNDFPMSIYDLVSAACTVAGVTLGSASWPLSTQTVNAFFANVTCRNILQYAAEIACRFVRCDSAGEVIFDWYTTNSTYSIHPSNTQSGYIAYKQDGLEYANYSARVVEAVAIKPSGTDGAAYIYPTTYGAITATDDGEGNIILTNITATDNNGNIAVSAEAEDDGDGNVEISSSAAASNTLILGNNLLLTNATPEVFTATAQNIYTVLSALGAYRPARINLFPFENPFRAGEIISVTDAQGVTFNTVSMGMTVSASAAVIESTGNEVYADESNTQKTLKQLASDIVQIDKLKVGYAEIDEAVINTLETNDITAKNLTVIDDDGNVVATYSGNVVIGKDDETHLEIDFNSLKLIDKEGNTYFYVSDLRDETGYAEVVNRFTGDGETTTFDLSVPRNQMVSVTIDGVDVPSSDYTTTRTDITFTTAPADASRIVVVYTSNSQYLKAFTFGTRSAGSVIGIYSFAEGLRVTASGETSHAEGVATTASGGVSHAEGWETNASGEWSHAEGWATTASGETSHAEGTDTTASGLRSHAEGSGTTAIGSYSHAEGSRTIARGLAQHVSGKFNIEDTNNTYAEIIGNGTSDANRSNARTLDWNGNEVLAGGLTIDGSTDVGSILTALTADSGWIDLSPVFYRKVGSTVFVSCHAQYSTALTGQTWTTIATLPDGYRPSRRIDAAGAFGANAEIVGAVRIESSGNIDVYPSAAVASPYIAFSASYPV